LRKVRIYEITNVSLLCSRKEAKALKNQVMNNQNFAATMFNAVFPILNTAQVYLGYGCSREATKVAFCEAFQECQNILEKGEGSYLEPEWYIEQFKKWAKQTEEIIFMSLLTYHPEKFYPQQIDKMPEDLKFWEGLYEKEEDDYQQSLDYDLRKEELQYEQR
jgi:hypothetical protein